MKLGLKEAVLGSVLALGGCEEPKKTALQITEIQNKCSLESARVEGIVVTTTGLFESASFPLRKEVEQKCLQAHGIAPKPDIRRLKPHGIEHSL